MWVKILTIPVGLESIVCPINPEIKGESKLYHSRLLWKQNLA